MIYRLLSTLIGYGCGIIIVGYFIGRKKGVNLKTEGSGNVGMTNTSRVLGAKFGAVAFICDVLKAMLAAFLAWLIFRNIDTGCSVIILMLYASFGAVLGHDFPFYLGFKGGKGIATALGLIFANFPLIGVTDLALFIIIVIISKYVSLGSIIAAIGLIAHIFIFAACGWLPYQGTELIEAVIITTVVGMLALISHRSNFIRLLNGTENRIHQKKKTEGE